MADTTSSPTAQAQRKGIVLAGGSGTRLYPLTKAVSKQLMPVYDKPMVYYPLSILMLTGIREILLISTPHDLPLFKTLLRDGSQWGMNIQFAEQARPEGLAQAFPIAKDFLNGAPATLVLGDNLFYGTELIKKLRAADARKDGATVFGYAVSNPEAYGVVEFDENLKVLSLQEKPEQPRSSYAIPGLYFYDTSVVERAQQLAPSARGELEITDLNRTYLEEEALHVEQLGRGTAWLDTGSHESLLEAAQFVHVIEKRQGLKISCPEEIAFRNHWIDDVQLRSCIDSLGKTQYADYLRKIL